MGRYGEVWGVWGACASDEDEGESEAMPMLVLAKWKSAACSRSGRSACGDVGRCGQMHISLYLPISPYICACGDVGRCGQMGADIERCSRSGRSARGDMGRCGEARGGGRACTTRTRWKGVTEGGRLCGHSASGRSEEAHCAHWPPWSSSACREMRGDAGRCGEVW